VRIPKAMAPFLNELCKISRDSGIETGLHPHANTIVETPAEIDMIMAGKIGHIKHEIYQRKTEAGIM
jgi:sugar phosphate isomerase/epimerase